MPKLKTNRGAAKRFKRTASGRFRRRRGFHTHNFTSKSAKRKRKLRGPDMVSPADHANVQALMPYA